VCEWRSFFRSFGAVKIGGEKRPDRATEVGGDEKGLADEKAGCLAHDGDAGDVKV